VQGLQQQAEAVQWCSCLYEGCVVGEADARPPYSSNVGRLVKVCGGWLRQGL
jgi:hypothetical protein